MLAKPKSTPDLYLDANAGAPLRTEVLTALPSWLALLSNPSSLHSFGRKAKRLLNDARDQVARSLGPRTLSEQILFTSSGTEANQLAIRSTFEPALLRGEKPHWITTSVEHDSILRMVDWLKERGGTVSVLPVDSEGRPEVERLSELVRPETRLVSAIWVNNETGVITDVEQLSREALKARVPLHLDGAQAWGKIPLTLLDQASSSTIKFVSFSGHKIGALSGTGVLWRAGDVHPHPLMPGSQEFGIRGGTENLIGILSLGTAAACLSPMTWERNLLPIRESLEREILSQIPGVIINGAGAPRVANTMNLSFERIERAGLTSALDLAGFAVSSGSACSSGVTEPSHVLLAMGRPPGLALSSIRVSFTDAIPSDAAGEFVKALASSVQRMRNSSS